mgnify:FL=1|jgi:hypothetical protein
MSKNIQELGSAGINVELSNGVITVRHSESPDHVLKEWKATKGDWDSIFKTFDLLEQLSKKIWRE